MSLTILVVDDSATECAILEGMLRSKGHRVITAMSGQVAIGRAAAEQPDIILMDIVMPGLNGFQAIRAIADDERIRHIPVVICSGKKQDSDRIWGLRQGARDYITKPVDERLLLQTISSLVPRAIAAAPPRG